MKLDKPKNENYAATVVRIKSITQLEGCDNVVGVPIFGFQAIVSKTSSVGDIGLVFPAETQLSEEYMRENNLYRHGDLNKDKEQKGYIEDNCRVKAMKFRGHRSDCLFMPLESLDYTGVLMKVTDGEYKGRFATDLKDGDTFDKLNGHEICKKFAVKTKEPKIQQRQTFKRIESKFLPEHFDSENFFRNEHIIPRDKRVVVTQKLHGTSIRVGHTIVKRKLSLKDRVAQYLGVMVQQSEMDYVFGSRKVIKDVNHPDQQHFYSTDIWSDEGKKLEGILPENFLLYGELIGWTPNNAPIQKNYTYQIPVGTCELYVYRIAFINGQGKVVDLSWEQVKEFCRDYGLKHVPELWTGQKRSLKIEQFIDKRLQEEGYDVLPLEPNTVDEGVCIRVDGLTPYILKAKSPIFLQHETKMLDEEAVDLEAEG